MTEKVWYVAHGTNQSGPHAYEEIAAAIAREQIPYTATVWQGDWAKPAPVRNVFPPPKADPMKELAAAVVRQAADDPQTYLPRRSRGRDAIRDGCGTIAWTAPLTFAFAVALFAAAIFLLARSVALVLEVPPSASDLTHDVAGKAAGIGIVIALGCIAAGVAMTLLAAIGWVVRDISRQIRKYFSTTDFTDFHG